MIPPQAITTRDMSEAYKWLQSLPASVREELKSMEQAVSMYLHAKRTGSLQTFGSNGSAVGATAASAPPPQLSKSGQEFQKTLKSLQHELEQFDFTQAGAELSAPVQSQQVPPQREQPAREPEIGTSFGGPHLQPLSVKLDPKSRQILNEIREGLNLSSDIEVVRMSLVLAQKVIKDLLK